MKLYLAGPMTGLPDFNYPAFRRTARLLRASGHEVISPAELHEAVCGDMSGISMAAKQPCAFVDFLRRDLSAMLECEGVVLLPGWEKSRGACLEAFVAAYAGLPVYDSLELKRTVNVYRILVTIGEAITGPITTGERH